jgi:hypothetical protein
VCCARCDFCFIRKWQISKNSMCSRSNSVWAKLLQKLEDVETFFQRGNSRTQICDWFSNFRIGVTWINDAELSWYLYHQNMKLWCESRNLFLKVYVSSVIWLMECESHLGHAKAFWHMFWTCDRLLQNCSVVCWLTSTSRIISGPSEKSLGRLTCPFQDQGDRAQVVQKGRRFYDIPIQQQSYDALAQSTGLL